jgi:hypothetical protein
VVAFGDDAHFFWCKVGQLFFEGCFFEICFFVGPRENICDFDLSFLVDENIVGANVSDFSFDFAEVTSTAH